MPEDKLKQFYEFIPTTKRVDDSFLGDYNTFSDLVADSNNRVKLFKNLAKAGFTENEIGTEQQFHDYFNTIFPSNGKATSPVTKQDFTGSTIQVPDNLKAIPKPNENSKAKLSNEIQKATAYDGQVRKAKDFLDNDYIIKDGQFDADGKPLSTTVLVEDKEGKRRVLSTNELKDFEHAPPELVEQTTQEIARLEQEDLKAPKFIQEVPLALGNDTIKLPLMKTHEGEKYFAAEFPTQKEAEQVLTALKEQVKDEFEIFETEGQKLFEDELTQRVFRIRQIDEIEPKQKRRNPRTDLRGIISNKPFWDTYVGDMIQKVGAGGAEAIANLESVKTIPFKMAINSATKDFSPEIRKAVTDIYLSSMPSSMSSYASHEYFKSKAEELRSKSDRYENKDFTELWSEDKGAAIGQIFLTASESIPISIAAMFGGAPGLIGIGVSTAAGKYDSLNEPDKNAINYVRQANMGEVAKLTNAVLTGAAEAGSEYLGSVPFGKYIMSSIGKIGGKATKEVLEKGLAGWMQKMFKKFGLAFGAVTEGSEEFANAIAENTIDYFTGARPDYKPFDGAGKAFVYGFAGGSQFAMAASLPMAYGELKTLQERNEVKKSLKSSIQDYVNARRHEDGNIHKVLDVDGNWYFVLEGDVKTGEGQLVLVNDKGEIKKTNSIRPDYLQTEENIDKYIDYLYDRSVKELKKEQIPIEVGEQFTKENKQITVNKLLGAFAEVEILYIHTGIKQTDLFSLRDLRAIKDKKRTDLNEKIKDVELKPENQSSPSVQSQPTNNTVPLPENFTGIEIIKEVNDGKQDLVLAIITDNNGNSETITMPKEQAALAQVMINLPEGYRIKQKDGIIYLTDAEGVSYTFRNAEAVQSYLNETPVVNKPKSENNVPNNTIKHQGTKETLSSQQENIPGKPEQVQPIVEQSDGSVSELENQSPQEEKKVEYAKNLDGSLKTKDQYTPEEWQTYTKSVIDKKLSELPEDKQVWQLSKDEFIESIISKTQARGYELNALVNRAGEEHKKAVQQALSEDKQIPDEVLAGYPELKKLSPKVDEKVDGYLASQTKKALDYYEQGDFKNLAAMFPYAGNNAYYAEPVEKALGIKFPPEASTKQEQLDFAEILRKHKENNTNFVNNENDGQRSNNEDAGIQPEGKTGSSRNDEVAFILRGDGQTDSGTLRGSQSSQSEQEEGLKKYAEENGILFSKDQVQELSSEQLPSGKEADVYISKSGTSVVKVINYKQYSRTPLDFFINRISVYNTLFEGTAYNIIGFTETDKGGLSFIVEQPFIKGKLLSRYDKSPETYQEQDKRIADYLKDKFGMESAGLDAFENDQYLIEDLHHKNVIEGNDGQLYFIDVIPTLKKQTQQTSSPEQIKEQEAATNPNPSDAQKEAGNFKKGHIAIQGLNITIENPKGSERSGIDKKGKAWSQTMNNTYGYFKRSKGKDGDQIDVFIGDNLESDKVFVVDQVNNKGKFDEHKVMMGFNSIQEAKEAYLSNYEEGWQGLGEITEVNISDFKKWLDNGTRKQKAFADYKRIKKKRIGLLGTRLEASKLEVYTPYELAQMYFILGGQVNHIALFKLFGTKGKENEPIVKARVTSEKRARFPYYSNKKGLSIDEIAHKLWEENEHLHFEDSDYRDAIGEVILSYNSPITMAKDLLEAHGERGMNQVQNEPIPETIEPTIETEEDIKNNERIDNYNERFADVINEEFYYDNTIFWSNLVALTENDPEYFTIFPHDLTKGEFEEFKKIIKDDTRRRIYEKALGKSGTDEIEQAEGFARGEEDFKEESDESYDADDGRREGYKPDRIPTTSGTEDGAAETAKQQGESSKEQLKPLTPEQQYVSDEYNRRISELKDLLKTQRHERTNKLNAIDKRNGLFGDTQKEEGNLFDSEFNTSIDNIDAILQPFDAKISHTVNQIEILLKQKQQAIDAVQDQAAIEFEEDKDVQFAGEMLKEEPKTERKASNQVPSAEIKQSEKIEDFGEKISGAKKDTYQRLKEIKPEDIVSMPLSKSFPRPDFVKLVADGLLNEDAALIMKFLYSQIPAKPRKKYKVASWAATVQKAIDTYKDFLDKEGSAAYFREELQKTSKYSGLAQMYFKFEEVQKALGFPKEDINTGAYEIKKFHRGEISDKEGITYSIVKSSYILSDHKNIQEAADALKVLLSDNKEKSKGVKLSVYKDTKTGKYFIGKKTATGVQRLIDGIETVKEASTMMKTQDAQLQELWDGLKLNPEERRKTNRARVGTDYRKGKDIDAEEFGDTFQFRGVQFGNWVNNKERQDALNDTYDALMDLSTALKVSPASLSLAGELGIAFGARGGGSFSAHYESDQVVINMTKTRGAGSLAHEWWHAIDNYFSRMRGNKNDMLTQSPRQAIKYGEGRNIVNDESIRTEMLDAFKGVVDAIRNSKLPARSKQLDASRSKVYWSDIVEMSARSFENFIIEKLGAGGEQNDYLANFKETAEWINQGGLSVDNYPYPIQIESEAINNAYQQFFDAIQEKEVDGKQVLFQFADNEDGNNKQKVYPENNIAIEANNSYLAENKSGNETQEQENSYKTRKGENIPYRSLLDSDSETRPNQVRENRNRSGNSPHLRKLKKGEFSTIERKYTADKNFSFTGNNTIESDADIAFLFRQLETASVENAFAVYIDKNGKAVIQHLSMGTFAGTIMDQKLIIDGVKRFNAEKVYFVHNHPSGNLQPSNEDVSILNKLKSALPSVDVLAVIININSGEYSIFHDSNHSVYERPIDRFNESAKKKYPVLKFDRQVFKDDVKPFSRIKSSQDIAAFISAQRLSAGKKGSLIVLNRTNNIKAKLELGAVAFSSEQADEVASYVIRFGGESAILFGRYGKETIKNRKSDVNTFNNILKAKGITLLDVIDIGSKPFIDVKGYDGFSSMADLGLISEPSTNNNLLFDIADIKPSFKEQLQDYIDGNFPSHKALDINVSKDGVLEKFIAPLPLKMRQRVLKKHQEEYEAEQLFDLEHEINNPVFILQGEHQGSVTVLTKIKDKKGNNILGAIELNVKMQEGIKFYEINNITSLYGKTSENLLKWIENGKLLYAEKEKGLDWLVSQTGSDSPRVLTIQNLIVQKYEEYQRKSSNDLKFLIRPETPQFASEILTDAYYQKYLAWEKAMKDEINRVANELGLKVISVPSEESLPRIYRRAIKSRGMEGKATGFFDTESGAIYVIIANNKSTKSVYELLLHEGVAHKGLRLLFGDKYNAFLESIYNQMTAKDIDTIIKRGYNPDDKHEIADEFLAKMAEPGKRPTWFDKIIAQIRELIRKIFGLNYSNKDIINLLELSRRALRKQQANNKPKTGHDPQFAGELLDTRFMTNLWHGSPHLFDKFSTKHIGTGEGAQAYGWGLYFTDREGIAKSYADSLSWKNLPDYVQRAINKIEIKYQDISDSQNGKLTAEQESQMEKERDSIIDEYKKTHPRNLYKVKIHGDKTIEELNFLRWDKELTADQLQSIKSVYDYFSNIADYKEASVLSRKFDMGEFNGLTGEEIYNKLMVEVGGLRSNLESKYGNDVWGSSDKIASLILLDNGIDGIQYPAEYTSKGSHENSFNYVVFDENAIEVDDHIRFSLNNQTSTPEFKQWFGDWEKPARIEKLKQSKPLIMSGNEYKGKYELNRASAQRYILDNLRARYINKDTGDEITLTRRGTYKVTSHDSENTVHLKSIAAIPEMIENAIFITEEKNTKENAPFDAFRYYVVGLKIDNEDYTARITIGKEGKNYYYDHGLTQIEKGELITNIGLLERRLNSDQLTLSDYKDTRLISLLQDNSSKVVDKNGSPLEVYHGSPEDFNEFDVTKPAIHRKSENIDGIYFSGNINTASNYRGKGGKIKKVYLSIQNPLDITPLIAKYQKKGMKYMEAKLEALKSLDKSLHDGVIFKGNAYNQSEYVVFSSNQIKSATNNNGEFDAKNPDIRFSLGGEHLKRLDDYKKADPEYQEIVDKFKDALNNVGLADKLMGVSKSQTDYGMSWYIKLKDIKGNETYEPFTIRISDHSVTSMNRLGDQKNLAYINYRYVNESDYDELVNKYKQALDYQKQAAEKRDELTRAADQKRENIKQESQDFLDDILQQGKAIFNSNQRFNSLKEIKEKHPDWEHILWNGNEIKDHNDRVWYVAPDNKYGKKYIPEIYYNYLKKEGLLDKEADLRFKFDEEGEWIEESDNKHTPNQPESTEFAGELLEGISKHMDRRRKLKQTLESLYTASREVLQDRDLLLRHMLEDAWKNGGKKTEGGNPYRDKNLGYGRMENLYTEFKDKLMMPLVKAINKLEKVKGVDLNQIMAYMIAKHAPERNAYIRKQKLEEWLTFHENASEDEVNEMIFELNLKDFSGIGALDLTNEHDKRPDELANRLAAEFEAKVPKELIDEFWQKIKPTTDFAIEQWLASEAISDKQYQEIKKMYKHFVPLRGWHEAAEKYLSYHHRSGGEPSIQKTLGRVSLPDNPIAYIEQVAFKSITERVNNEVNQALLEFVMVNPNKDLYELKEVYYVKVEDGKGENDWVMTTTRPDQAMFKAGKAKKTMYNGHERFRKPSQAKEHEVIVHLKGRDIAIVMKGEMLPIAQIMNHHNNLIRIKGQDVNLDAMNNFLGNTIGVGVNMLKQLYTSLNIVFPYTNYSRDLGEAFSTTVIMADGKQAFDYLSYNPTAFNTIRSYLWGSNFNPEKNANHKLYHEFLMDGGTTGYSHNQTIEERSRELKKQIENSFKGVHFSLTAVKEQIENISRLFEDATRFSIYVSARKNGKSRKDAAAEAKEASVNFNRKGKATKTFDSLYAFFNPAIQSLQKNTHLAKKYPKRFAMVSVAWMMFGFIIAELNRLFDDDEDDDKGYYNINTYVRENYLVLPVFGEESYLRIPLPQFWRGFYSWGVLASDVIHGKKTVAKAVSNGGINFASGLTPVDVGGFVVDGKFSIGPLIPTIYKPVYEIGVNRNFLDQPIYRAIFDETQLQSKLHLNYVNPALKVITDGLLAIAHPKPDSKYMYYKKEDGSIEQVPSMFDINPSKVEHLIRSYGGGTIKAAGDLFGMLYSAVMPTENVVIDNVPIINAFIRKYPEKNYEVDETYYKLKEEAEINKKLYNEAVNPKNMKKDLSDPKNFINQDDLKREFIIKNAEYQIKQLKDQLTDEQIDLDTYYTKAAEIRHKAVSDIKQPKNK